VKTAPIGWITRLNQRAPVGDLAIILVLGLAPLLWFREGKLLNSEDLMVPPNWDEFTQFWYVWNDQLGTGAQKILDSGRFPTLFIAAVLQGLGVGLVQAQMVQFVFWFTLPGLGMYYLMAGVYHGDHERLARLAAVLFYMFNLWLISNWLGYKEPMIAAVAVLPFVIGIWVRTFSADTGYLRAVFVSGLVSLAASPIGNNVSEMIAAFIPIPLLFLTVAIVAATRRRWPALRRLLLASLALTVLIPLLHLFWIVPEIIGINAAQNANSFPEFQRVSSQFLEGQSIYTSITNNIRFVSDWTWYQGLVDPYRTYAASFADSGPLKLLGWSIFGIVLVGAALGRGTYKRYFVIATVVGLIASAGLNSPIGPAYSWAVDNLPFVWIIRSPWFKFSILTVLGYSVLLGLAAPFVVRVAKLVLVRIVGIWSDRVATRGAVFCALAVSIASGPVYAYPLTFGLSFATDEERTFLNPNHTEPPAYVYEAADWLNRQPGEFRIMTIPGDSPWLNDWGYSGFGSFLQTLTPHPLIFKRSTQSIKISQGAPNASGDLVDQIDADLLDERSESAVALLSRLGVRYLVHERDVRYDFYQGSGYRSTDSPDNVRRILSNAPGLVPAATFGAWDIYEIESPRAHFEIASGITAVMDLDARLVSLLTAPSDNRNTAYVALEDLPPGADRLLVAEAAAGQLSPPRSDVLPIVFADTSALDDTTRAPVPEISIRYGDPDTWGQFEEFMPGQTWRWFTLNNGDHYLVTNDSQNAVMVELSLNVLSYARQRSFFVYLNSELLSVTDVPPDTPTTIRVPDTQVNPGENVISFYTPYPSDQRGTQNLAFAIRDDLRLSRAIYSWRPAVPFGEYWLRVTLRPFGHLDWPVGRPDPLIILVDGLSTSLAPENGMVSRFSANVQLNRASTVTVPQIGQEEYFLELTPVGAVTDPAAAGAVTLLKTSATSHLVQVDCDSPCVVIFNESYHRDWVASVDGRPLTHFKVDHYANAYLIENPGAQLVKIVFEPQRWFELAVVVSTTAAAIASLILFASRKRNRFDPTNSGEPHPS